MSAGAADSSRGDVLAITDGSPAGGNAVWRAALIARERGAPLRLLHMCDGREPAPAAHRALEAIAGKIGNRLGIEAATVLLEGDPLHNMITATRTADLLVIGPRRANPLRDWISGTQAERLIRLCRVPTLVVKRPAAPGRDAALGSVAEPGRYGRVLVPVDLREESVAQVACAMRYSRDPRMQVFHAVRAGPGPRARGAALRVTGSGSGSGSGSGTVMELAHSALAEIVRASGAHEQGAVCALGYGAPVDCVLERAQAAAAELVVLGKRRQGLLAHFFMGRVTQQVLAHSRADVLILPAAGARPETPARCADDRPARV